jgi:hypothetical protein
VKNKIIFLDIDGVLNSEHYFKSLNLEKMTVEEKRNLHNSLWGNIDPKCYLCFVNTMKQIDADIVLSSSWRDAASSTFFIQNETADILADSFKKDGINVIGATPDWFNFASKEEIEMFYNASSQKNYAQTHIFSRAAEIYQWIKVNNFTGKWCAIDDDTYDMYPIQKSGHFIQTSWYYINDNYTGGFASSQAEKLISFFKE